MNSLQYRIDVAYKQIAIFRESEEDPFPLWTDSHVRQGFAWRPGVAAFSTLRDGIHVVEIASAETEDAIEPEVIRAIEVPFDLSGNQHASSLEVASIADSASFPMPSSNYTLRFEIRGSPQEHKIRFTFIARKGNPRFSVPRIDADLEIIGELVTTAEPA